MNTETVFIAFGSNQGDRQDWCDRAVALMKLLPHSTVTGVSSYYETEPVATAHGRDDTWFYNGVARLDTRLSPEHLWDICRETERALGRDDVVRHGPRTMDLDVLFYGQRIIETPPLTIPHPRLHQRRFVLAPMTELAPHWVHPLHHRTMQSLLDHLADAHRVRKIETRHGSSDAARSTCADTPAR